MFLRAIKRWFIRPSPERMVLDALHSHWTADGLPARVEGDLVYLGVDDLAARVEVQGMQSAPAGYSAVLWFRLLPADNPVWEVGDVATGMGASKKEALMRAALNWLHRVPPSVLLGLYGQDLYKDREVWPRDDAWGLPGCTVYSSPYQVLGLREQEIPDVFSKAGMWQAVRDVFRKHFSLDTVHWLKLFHSTNGWQCEADCFVDNRTWDRGRDALLSLEPPEVKGPLMLWQFVLVVPDEGARVFPATAGLAPFADYDEPTEPSPGLPTLRDQVLLTLEMFRKQPPLEMNEITDALVERNIDRRQAEMLVALVPIAYGRALFRDTKVAFADRFLLTNGKKGQKQRRRMAAEATFKIAWSIADQEISSGRAGRDAKLAVAGWSPEFEAINKALHGGSRLENLMLGDPMVLVSFDLDTCSDGDARA